MNFLTDLSGVFKPGTRASRIYLKTLIVSYLIVIPPLVAFGCSQEQVRLDEAVSHANGTTFHYHHQTKLCFAHYGRGITNVPCTPEVLSLCPNKP